MKIIAVSQSMRKVVSLAAQAAAADASFLIEGETSVGKRLIARAVHSASRRGAGPFVRLVVGSVRTELLEACLFGSERGGVLCPGLLEQARGGTLFLHDICGIPGSIQMRLAAALRDGWFIPANSNKRVLLGARLIAATTSDLRKALASGLLPRELHAELREATIRIAPLRDRKEDILPLASHFLLEHNHLAFQRHRAWRFSPEAAAFMTKYAWPGNVQELWNAVRRGTIFAQGKVITAVDLADPPRKGSLDSPDQLGLIASSLLGGPDEGKFTADWRLLDAHVARAMVPARLLNWRYASPRQFPAGPGGCEAWIRN